MGPILRSKVQIAGLSCQRSLCLFYQGLERLRLADGEISQNLSVDLNARLFEAAHKSCVIDAMLPACRVNPLDPQCPEGAFAYATVTVGILPCLFHRLLGDPDGVLAPTLVASGLRQNFFVFGVRGHAAFYTCHFISLLALAVRHEFLDELGIRV